MKTRDRPTAAGPSPSARATRARLRAYTAELQATVAPLTVAYRDGLMTALLAQRPMRERNLASIACGRHLVRRGTDWWLVFSAAEINTGHKMGQGLEFPFPANLVPGLQRYLDVHRPVLLGRGQRRAMSVAALWVSRHGSQLGAAAIWHQACQRTAAAFGKPLSPHLSRDATGRPLEAAPQIRFLSGATVVTSA